MPQSIVRFSVLTFGCRVNQAESLTVEAGLRERGGTPVEPVDADFVVVNSCSVTASADQGTRQAIRKIARENPSARIIVTGCYATRSADEVCGLPGVIRVIPNQQKDDLVASCEHLYGDDVTTADRYAGGDGACGAWDRSAMAPGALGRTAFTLRVQTGCEESCAYCIIPSTRGSSRSMPLESLVTDVRRIEGAGYREVTLTGVHLGAYGRDLAPRRTLLDLLDTLLGATDRLVFRLGSLEPMDCPSAIVRLAEGTDRLAPAFHLPLQHASDRMLLAMRRPYTRAQYAASVDEVRKRLPHAGLTADVIVGFPGEGDEDVEALVSYLETSPLTQLHVFPYSDRPGTEATAMSGKVHGTAVRHRGALVRAVGEHLAARFRASQDGRECRVLTIDDGRIGVTDTGLRVPVEDGHLRNEHIRVRLALEGGRLVGRSVQAGEREART
jgi:threonylcarbamoyladenosine tRNA methylthiotransferase MtaB